MVATIEKQAAALRKEGADNIVVAVVHTGRAKDEEMYRLHAADIILSRHDHDLWLNYDGRTAAIELKLRRPFRHRHRRYLHRTNGGRPPRRAGHPEFRIIDTRNVAPDPAVLAVVNDFEKKLSSALDIVIATTAVELDSRNPTVRTQEAAIGDLIADAMRSATGADIAITNGGGIRGGRIHPPGPNITRRDIMSEAGIPQSRGGAGDFRQGDPWGLENVLSLMPRPAGRFPQVSGLKIVVDLSKPVGERVISVLADGAPLEDKKFYKLATNDFMAGGGDGYSMFDNVHEIVPGHDGPLMSNEVIEYLEKIRTVRNGVDGRIVIK